MRAPLVVGVGILAAGIAVGAQRPVSPGEGPLLLVAALMAAALSGHLARPGVRIRSARAVLALLLLVGGLLGMAARTHATRSCAAWMPDLDLIVHGWVVGGAGDRLRLALSTVDVADVRVRCGGEVSVRWDGEPPAVGTAVVGHGRWWRPPGAATMRPAGLLLLDSLTQAGDAASAVAGGWTMRTLGWLRAAARGRVDRVFGDRAPLAASLLLAQRDGLDRDVRDRFARAGLSHLLAISGLHVGLVAGIFLLLVGALPLGRRGRSAAAGLGTLAYVGFLGAPHSATRAALQIILVLTARAAQRPARTEALIATAALLLLAGDPGALFSPGFQLSFAGVTGILALRRPLLRRLDGLAALRIRDAPVGRWFADGLATSVAATVATAPVVAWHFGRVAPVGIVANLLAIPLLAATVPALALALLAGFLWVPVGRFLAGAGAALLDALDATARVAADVPGGTVAVPASTAVLLTAAVGAGYLATRRLGRTRTSIRALVWAVVAAAVLMVAPLRPTADRVEVHVIDVGQGDAIALRSPAGRWLLVDAGVATDRYDAGARLVVPYLARRGARRLEGLVVTHPDADHMGGAGAVMGALRPRWVVEPGLVVPKAGYLALLRAAAERGIPWVTARRGMTLEIDGMVVDVLHPSGGTGADDANDASVVLRVAFGEFEAVLTGDAPAAVELELVRRYGHYLEAEVLKVGHHGSLTSTSPELLTAMDAELAVISAGRDNRYGHPHRRVVERLDSAGMVIARTDRHGSVVVRGTSRGAVTVETERGTLAVR